MQSAPPIFVVNLFRDHARRQHISEQLDALNLSYEFTDAVSKDYLCERHYALYDDAAVQRRVQRSLTSGELACAFSHAEVWQEILRRELGCAIVLEDDAVLEPEFVNTVRELSNFPADWEVLNFCSQGKVTDTGHVLASGLKIVRFLEKMNGTVGYCGTRSGFTELLEHVYPLKAAADGLISSMVKINLLRAYGTRPQLVTTGAQFDSSVGARNSTGHG